MSSSSSSGGAARGRDGGRVRLRAEPVGVAGLDGVDVRRLRRHVAVGVAGIRVAGVVRQRRQVVGVGAAQDLVARDGVVAGVGP